MVKVNTEEWYDFGKGLGVKTDKNCALRVSSKSSTCAFLHVWASPLWEPINSLNITLDFAQQALQPAMSAQITTWTEVQALILVEYLWSWTLIKKNAPPSLPWSHLTKPILSATYQLTWEPLDLFFWTSLPWGASCFTNVQVDNIHCLTFINHLCKKTWIEF